MITEIFDELNKPLAEVLKVSPSQLSTLAGGSAIGVISNELLNQFTKNITPVIKLGAGIGAMVTPALADIELDSRTRDEILIIGSILSTTGAMELAKNWQPVINALQSFFSQIAQGRIGDAFASIIRNPFATATPKAEIFGEPTITISEPVVESVPVVESTPVVETPVVETPITVAEPQPMSYI